MIGKKTISSLLASALVLLAMAFFLAAPARYVKSVSEGVSLWAVSVLPATFPFLFLTALFTRMKTYERLSRVAAPLAGKLFRVSGAGGCATALSMLSGYPVGARTVLDLYEKGAISKEESFRLACLCSTTGPMFLIGVVGCALFKSALLGWILLFSHYFGVLAVCFFLRFTGKPLPITLPPMRKQTDENLLFESLTSSVLSILSVGGSIALFYAFGQMLADAFALVPMSCTTNAVLRGLMEMTSGCGLLSQTPSPLSAALSCFLVTFGGACVLAQQFAFLSRANVKLLPFLGVKLLQATVAGGAAYLLSLAIF